MHEHSGAPKAQALAQHISRDQQVERHRAGRPCLGNVERTHDLVDGRSPAGDPRAVSGDERDATKVGTSSIRGTGGVGELRERHHGPSPVTFTHEPKKPGPLRVARAAQMVERSKDATNAVDVPVEGFSQAGDFRSRCGGGEQLRKPELDRLVDHERGIELATLGQVTGLQGDAKGSRALEPPLECRPESRF
jgi:hypothetical protein